MLTVEQVKSYSDVSIGSDRLGYISEGESFTKCMARLIYVHNGRASKMRIICALPDSIERSDVETISEDEIKDTIDWQRFTTWINRHDDLTEDNIVTIGEWAKFQSEHPDTCGRNGELDTINNQMNDLNKVVLV